MARNLPDQWQAILGFAKGARPDEFGRCVGARPQLSELGQDRRGLRRHQAITLIGFDHAVIVFPSDDDAVIDGRSGI